jgi:hypothetical protein
MFQAHLDLRACREQWLPEGCGRAFARSDARPERGHRRDLAACNGVNPVMIVVELHRKPPATRRRIPTGRTMISGPSTSTVWFLC